MRTKSPIYVWFFFISIWLSSFLSCRQEVPYSAGSDRCLKVVNWNVQTFFDAVTTGDEYQEFVKSDRWGREAYIQRLERLCSVIKLLDADVFIMEEIENEGVVQDISNFLAGQWDSSKVYRNACFAKSEGSSIGCAVLSRTDLGPLRIHSMDVRSEEISMPKLRPIMEVTVSTDKGNLILFVNHWKSKSGGEDITEIWRNREEGILAELVNKSVMSGKAVLVAGDFNRDIEDFYLKKNGKVVLRFWENGCLGNKGVEVETPWVMSGNRLVQPGSYFYKDEWSRIDNIFSSGSASIIEFYPAVEGPWCDANTSVPNRYQIWNGTGYSDHLPVCCVVRF